MKSKFLTLLLLLSAAVVSAETMRVAILEPVDRENKVGYGTKLILRSNLSKAVTNTAGYEAYDRSDMDAIMGEQNFQRTGMVSEDQIKRLGEMTGAKYILVAEAAIIDANNMFITAKVLDVETARTIMTDNLMMGIDAQKMQAGCATLANRLFNPNAAKQSTQTNHTMVYEDNKASYMGNTRKTGSITCNGTSYYYNGQPIVLKDFLYTNCPTAYEYWNKNFKMECAGWGLLGGGAFLLTLSCIPMWPTHGMAVSALMTGCACMATGATLGSIGYVRRTKKAHEIFNQQCAQEKLTFNLQASQNGLGLALTF